MAVWCYRCNRLFQTSSALFQHTRDSSSHHECPDCDFDGESWAELSNHFREDGCRTVCEGCDDGDGAYWITGSKEYWQHVQDYNVCTKCERHFNSPSNLTYHKLTHKSAEYECFGCVSKFKTYGGMIIHLESNACTSDIDKLDLNATAAECHWWAHYIDEYYRDDMLNHDDLEDEYQERVYPFNCPTCKQTFSKLSSLFQHVESPCCGQTLEQGAIHRLKRFLYVRLERS